MNNKIKKIVNKLLLIVHNNRWLFLTFIVSTIIIGVVFKLQGIAPFGSNSMLDVDFFHQYGPLLNELTDRIKQGENLIFSFNTGGGIPFFRNYLNYLSSPFNIILLFLKKDNIIMGYSVIIALKLIFASCTMSYYLKKQFNKDSIFTLVFGLLYAYSGYFCAFYWNIMWLDGIVFLPIIMLGISKLIDNNKPYLYIVSLAIMLFANYFIGYMICIFSVLYFLGYLFLRGKYNIKYIFKKTILFAVSSLLAGGLVSFFLLPLATSLSSISATGGSFPAFEFNFKVIDYVFNHITGVSRTVFASDILPLPNIYCGLITLVFVLLLFLNKKVNIKIKIISLLCIISFFLFFDINLIDYIWHAFHVPNDLPWRYSFLYVFCLTTIGYYSSTKLKDAGILKTSISFALIIVMVMLSAKFDFKNITDEKALLCMILLLIYYLLFFFTKINNKTKIIGGGVLILVISIEMIYGINNNWSIDHDIETFMNDKPGYEKLIKTARKYNNDLYRIEKTSYVTLNDPAWYDYYGISTFSSMAYESVSSHQRMLGLAGNTINSYYYVDYQTPVYNTIFNISYIMGSSINSDNYKVIDSNETANLLEYKYPSSIGYGANKKLVKWNLLEYKPFYNQDQFVKLLLDTNESVYDDVKVLRTENVEIIGDSFNNNSNGEFNYKLKDKKSSFKFVLDNSKHKDLYIYVGGPNVSSFYVNDEYHSITSDEYYTLNIGTYTEDEVTIEFDLSSKYDSYVYFYAYTLNDDVFNKFYKSIKSERLNVTSYKETLINGNIKLKTDKMVFTSIAYDEGWKVYVDNKMVKTYKIADSFMAFNCPKGNHEIKIKYYPKNMKLGLVLSGFSVIILLVIMPYILKKHKKD